MSNNKQSSIEWLLSFIEPSLTPEQNNFFSMIVKQAKEINKQEIIQAYDEAISDFRQDQERPLKGHEYYEINYKNK